MLSLTSAKSGALIGVLISVTTIPAAANIGVAFALADWSEWRGAMAQLAVNLTAIVLAGVVTLSIQRRALRCAGGGAHAAATEPGRSPACGGRPAKAADRLMIRRLAILLAAFALGTRDRRRTRRGQPRRRARRRPGLLRGDAWSGSSCADERPAATRAGRQQRRSASSSSASFRSSGVVTFGFSAGAGVDQDPAARGLDHHRLVGRLGQPLEILR